MEGPISKFMHVQQPEAYWHQATSTSSAFKSPDLIELNSDTERNTRNVEPLNYSSSQEEAETEDDGVDAPDAVHIKEALTGVYDVTSNDEESCHLLQTEDDSESSDSEHAWNSSQSSSSHSSSSNGGTLSDGEGNEDQRECRLKQRATANYWEMTPEQEKYYTDQFQSLQLDLNGLVNGAVAKGFFEKSKLPHEELREIWQLADITKDGCLDFAEFKMAMHLVVLRRHGLPIPSHFYNRQPDFALGPSTSSNPPIFKIGGSVLKSTTPKTSKTKDAAGTSQLSPLVPCLSKPDVKPHAPQHKRPSKEWTTFENEPINFSSTCDTSGLVAPVPVRLKTPEDKLIAVSSSASNASASKAHQLQLKAIQRPKLSGHHPKVSTGTIAPPPPPRRKTHVRSSSLDLNRLTISAEMQPQTISGAHDVPTRSFLSPCHQGGAFSVYRKPQLPKAATIHEPPNIPPNSLISNSTTVQLGQQVQDLNNENQILSRVSTQLLDQLSGLQSRRQALGYKIHQLNGHLS